MNPYFLAADIFLENEEGEVLLLHRSEKKEILGGYYNGVGGKFETFESPQEALLREVKEEIGITDIQNIQLKVLLTVHDRYGDWLVFCYTGKVKKSQIRDMIVQNEGELEWVPKMEITSKRLVPDVRHWYPKLFEENISYVKVEYDEKYEMQKIEMD